jgi:hypothetical protein
VLGLFPSHGLPITILWGDQDRVLPESAFAALCEASGNNGDVVDGRHSWLIADPEGFGEIITNSLSVHSLLQSRTQRHELAQTREQPAS